MGDAQRTGRTLPRLSTLRISPSRTERKLGNATLNASLGNVINRTKNVSKISLDVISVFITGYLPFCQRSKVDIFPFFANEIMKSKVRPELIIFMTSIVSRHRV